MAWYHQSLLHVPMLTMTEQCCPGCIIVSQWIGIVFVVITNGKLLQFTALNCLKFETVVILTHTHTHIYLYEVYEDHHVMTCIGNRVNLHLFLTILTMLRKSWFYQYKIIVLSLNCHSPERWPHGGSCVAVLRSSTPGIYSLLVHLYSGVAQSTVCAIPPAMFN